jgi:hypothetical protein
MELIETHDLIGVVERIPFPVTSYWLDLCFPMEHTSQSEFIDFDIVDDHRRLAPFVAPTVQGQPMTQHGYSTRKFKPAYIKPKDTFNPTRVIQRRAGEPYTGAMSPAARRDAIVADILLQHVNGIRRRWEWMACRAAVDGAVTIAGDNYPTVQLSFGRNAANTKTLTGTALWTDTANSTPLDDIETWNQEMFDRAGYGVDRITFSPGAWKAFINHPSLKDMLDLTSVKAETSLVVGPTRPAPFQYRGTLKSANIQLWVYNDKYEDNQGVSQSFLTDGDIVLTSSAVDGVRAFGAILDDDANYQSLPMFPKMFKVPDPSGVFIMTQSAPLMIPKRPDATMRVTVK